MTKLPLNVGGNFGGMLDEMTRLPFKLLSGLIALVRKLTNKLTFDLFNNNNNNVQ